MLPERPRGRQILAEQHSLVLVGTTGRSRADAPGHGRSNIIAKADCLTQTGVVTDQWHLADLVKLSNHCKQQPAA